ncbi:hypothetical protein Leryth_004280 [Lithospermum erythrorhizon]|nr:hypothetical protein Leryth_004280 [Lithospermum erythrorhizon]
MDPSENSCWWKLRKISSRYTEKKSSWKGYPSIFVFFLPSPSSSIQWRALEEINAGVCDGMTYDEIKKNMPEEFKYVRILSCS